MQRMLKPGSPKSINRSLDCAVRRRPSMVVVRLGICYLALTAVALSTLGVQGCPRGGGTTSSIPPTATFTASKTAVHPGGLVLFSDTSAPGSKPITSWFWNFGDGSTSTEKNPLHSYTVSGRHTVELTVTTAAGSNTSTAQDYVLVYQPSARFSSGETNPEITSTIGPSGGIIFAPSGSLIEGFSVEFLPDTFAQDTDVTLLSDSGVLTPIAGDAGATALVLDTADIQPEGEILITAPSANPQNELTLLFHVEPDGSVSLVTLVAIDPTTLTTTFSTILTGTFVWITVPSDVPQKAFSDVETDFDPLPNGFAVENRRLIPYSEGNCYGMVGFAKWFFEYRGDKLFEKFPGEPIHVEPNLGPIPPPITNQRIIATRAQQSITLSTKKIIANNSILWGKIPDPLKFIELSYGMKNSGQPIVIVLDEGAEGDHAVLAYAIEGNIVHVYDPNKPGEARSITLGLTGFDLTSIGTYTSATPIGLSIPFWREPFETILYDAINDFNLRSYSYVEISSPDESKPLVLPLPNPPALPTSPVTLKGEIKSSGVAAVTKVRAYAINEKLGILNPAVEDEIPFDVNRPFSCPNLLLGPGKNEIILETYTRYDPAPPDQIANPELRERLIGNNYEMLLESKPLVLNVPLHLHLSSTSLALTPGSPSASVTVDSLEGWPVSIFPLRWKAKSSDSRIAVSPKQADGSTGNNTNVIIKTSKVTQTFDAEVAFTNLDNPSDVRAVSVHVTKQEPPVPAITSFQINNGDEQTFSGSIVLNNTCTGNPTHYIASESSGFSGASWQSYSNTPSFTLSPGNGTKTIYFGVKNASGNSSTVSDSINLNESRDGTIDFQDVTGLLEEPYSCGTRWRVVDLSSQPQSWTDIGVSFVPGSYIFGWCGDHPKQMWTTGVRFSPPATLVRFHRPGAEPFCNDPFSKLLIRVVLDGGGSQDYVVCEMGKDYEYRADMFSGKKISEIQIYQVHFYYILAWMDRLTVEH